MNYTSRLRRLAREYKIRHGVLPHPNQTFHPLLLPPSTRRPKLDFSQQKIYEIPTSSAFRVPTAPSAVFLRICQRRS